MMASNATDIWPQIRSAFYDMSVTVGLVGAQLDILATA